MTTHAGQEQQTRNKTAAVRTVGSASGIRPYVTDQRPDAVTQRKWQSLAESATRTSRLRAQQNLADQAMQRRVHSPNQPVIQRFTKVTGVFLDPTPDEGAVLQATGNPLTSPQFTVRARFDPVDPNTDCSFGVYRQQVRGAFRRNGIAQEHVLASGAMSETDWREDVIGRKRYGYRGPSGGAASAFFSDAGFTNKDLSNGPYFQSIDTPKATAEDDEMDLHFRGVLLDKDDGAVIAERKWSVYGKK